MAHSVIVEMRLEIILYVSCSVLAASLVVMTLLIISERAKNKYIEEVEKEMEIEARRREKSCMLQRAHFLR